MKIDRTRTPGASSGERHLRPAITCHQRTEHINGCTHFLDVLIRRLEFIDPECVDGKRMFVSLERDPHRLKQTRHRGNVAQVGSIAKFVLPARQERRGQQCKRRILCATDLNSPVKFSPPANDEFIQEYSPLIRRPSVLSLKESHDDQRTSDQEIHSRTLNWFEDLHRHMHLAFPVARKVGFIIEIIAVIFKEDWFNGKNFVIAWQPYRYEPPGRAQDYNIEFV